MPWIVEVRYDVVKGTYIERRCDKCKLCYKERDSHCFECGAALSIYNAFPYWDVFYVVARNNRKAYVHFYCFIDDYEGAQKLISRIKSVPDFTPEGSRHWTRVVELKPILPRRKKPSCGSITFRK